MIAGGLLFYVICVFSKFTVLWDVLDFKAAGFYQAICAIEVIHLSRQNFMARSRQLDKCF